MGKKVFSLDTQPGIQRDGTVFDKNFYTDGQWVRFQRGRPRKIGGYRVISSQLKGPSRGIWLNAQDNINYVYSGYSSGLESLGIDNNGIGSGFQEFSLSDFTASANNLWQFDGFYDVAGAGVQSLLAAPCQNLNDLTNTINTPVLIGDITGSTMSQIGVFTDSATTVNTNTTITLAATNPLIGAGQSISGTGIQAGTTVVSVSTTSVVMSLPATANGTVTVTFSNNISVSGGVVSLHPYVFVYGNNGLIQNCSAGNTNDWVSADANATNVATGKIVQGLPVRGGSNSPSGLFWSVDSVIRVSYIGGTGTPPQYWRYDIVSSQSSIMSSQCAIEYDGVYYWCGVDRFLMYNGVVKEIPNNMNQNWFFDNLNYNQRQKVWVTKVPRYGEIWWFYPRGDATECTDAIVYNVRENTWYDVGQSTGAYRSAGYFSQVFAFPIEASWVTSTSAFVFSADYELTNASLYAYSDTYQTAAIVGQGITGTGIASGTTLLGITSSNIKTLGSITGGSLYTNGTYTDVALTGGAGSNAKATIVVSGGSVTSVTLTANGAGYVVGNALSATAASIGGTGSGFSIPVSAIYAQGLQLSLAATTTATSTLSFSTIAGLINLYQHEVGTDEVNGQTSLAIRSYFETSDLGWVAGGPSQPTPVGDNVWVRVDRVEPDFVQSGEMEVYITGRPFAQANDVISDPYLFNPDTGKIDMREQRREIRLRFVSDVAGGNYQLGKVIITADIGDVRPYGS